MSEPSLHHYKSQQLELAYWSWGDAGKPPLLLLAGSGTHARSWDPVARALSDDYHVVASDLRGHGESEWATGSSYLISDHVPDLTALIDLLGGKVPVVAHSFGGAIALLAAGASPERFERIVSIEGVGARVRPNGKPLTPIRLREWMERLRSIEERDQRVYASLEDARDRLLASAHSPPMLNTRLTAEAAMHLARHGSKRVEGGYVWKFDPRGSGQQSPLEIDFEECRRFWANITCPVLHLLGEESDAFKFSDPDELNSLFGDSRAHVVPEAGHFVHQEQPDRTVDAIRPFLAESSASSTEDAAV